MHSFGFYPESKSFNRKNRNFKDLYAYVTKLTSLGSLLLTQRNPRFEAVVSAEF